MLPAPDARPLRVWDRAVRTLHWTLVLAVAAAWLSAWFGTWWPGWLHQPAGYVALGAVLLRLLWGGIGGGHARFAQFVRSPRALLAYLRLLWRGREPRYVGHNPLGGWMVLALLACIAGLGVTGWLYTTDRFWGDETVDHIHQTLSWLLLGLVVLHVAGVVFTSWRHRDALVRAMVDGRKRAAAPHDVA